MSINPFLLTSADLAAEWKDLRRALPKLELDAQLTHVAAFFALAPLLVRSPYDRSRLDAWPSPWEMMTNNKWCADSVAVGMDFTLRLGGVDPTRLTIQHIADPRDREQKLVLQIDDTYLLNYDHASVIKQTVEPNYILKYWKYNGKLYSEWRP